MWFLLSLLLVVVAVVIVVFGDTGDVFAGLVLFSLFSLLLPFLVIYVFGYLFDICLVLFGYF